MCSAVAGHETAGQLVTKPHTVQGWEHRPFQIRRVAMDRSDDVAIEHRTIQVCAECCRGAEYRQRGLAEHRPIQFRELRFPPFAHRAFGCLGTGAVDEAWKTHDQCCFDRGRYGSPTACRATLIRNPGDTKADPSRVLGSSLGVRMAVATVGSNIAPFNSEPSCVSYPSPTAPLAVWGTGAVDEAWKTHDRGRLDRGRCGGRTAYREHHQKPTPGDTEDDPFVINGVDGVIHALSTAAIPQSIKSRWSKGG